MDQPGVVVRPLRQISGAYHFNEVFLDDAFVAEEDLIGGLIFLASAASDWVTGVTLNIDGGWISRT